MHRAISFTLFAFLAASTAAPSLRADEAKAPPAADEAPSAAREPKAEDPESIKQDEPSFFVRVAVDRITRQYREGDPVVVSVTSEVDAHAYVLYKQADGKVYQIFPNSDQKDNRLTAKQAVQIPAERDTFTWRVAAPFGREVLKVVASKTPLEGLSAEELFAGRINPVPPEKVKDAGEELKVADPKTWAEDSVELTTYAKSQEAAEEATGRRIGLFVGLSKFKHNDAYKEITGGKWEPNLPSSADDARLTAQVMKELSRLDDVRVLVDEQATRANIEQAVSGWLPAASKPGDTVFLYIETHGDGIPDDNGDEPDGEDEFLMTHDYADAILLGYLVNQEKAGTISPENRVTLETLKGLVLANREVFAKLNQEQAVSLANLLLVHKTAVTDDLLAHWLQRLAGRKVVVMMATCHSGGFAANEKSLASAEPRRPVPKAIDFDFLTGELGRLKDIGQPDTVVISACTTKQVSYQAWLSPELVEDLVRRTGAALPIKSGDKMHTLPYGLVDFLAVAPPRQPIDVAFNDLRERVVKFVNKTSDEDDLTPNGEISIRHEPQLYNFSTRPIYLKP